MVIKSRKFLVHHVLASTILVIFTLDNLYAAEKPYVDNKYIETFQVGSSALAPSNSFGELERKEAEKRLEDSQAALREQLRHKREQHQKELEALTRDYQGDIERCRLETAKVEDLVQKEKKQQEKEQRKKERERSKRQTRICLTIGLTWMALKIHDFFTTKPNY